MVVCLQQAALAALEQDDGGVDNLVELAQVEPPAVPSEGALPEALDGDALVRALDGGRRAIAAAHRHQDAAGLLADLAQTTDGIGHAALVEGVVQAADHAHERPCRVHGEEDVVGDDEGLERPRLRDRVRLARGPAVEQVCGYGVGSGKGEWHADVEQRGVDVGRDRDVLRDDERRLAGGEIGSEGRRRKRQMDAAQRNHHRCCSADGGEGSGESGTGCICVIATGGRRLSIPVAEGELVESRK